MQPFFDRPDIQVPIIWYAVPPTREVGPPSFICDNWWDDREHFYPIGVGMVPNSMKPYFGPLPNQALGPLVGSAAEYFDGLSYAQYLSTGGSPSTPCFHVPLAGPRVKVRQGQAVEVDSIGGCRAYAGPCPLLNIPCQLDWELRIHDVFIDGGSADFDRATSKWSGTGSTFSVSLGYLGTNWVVHGSFQVPPLTNVSHTCRPVFEVVAAGPGGPLTAKVVTFAYPGFFG
jgi:hypothetical protein